SGPGIPESLLDKVFEPLFTTKLRGTGLGLQAVKNIIQQHQGTISVTNRPTIFTVSLPKNLYSKF
ncbi:MAG: ATP-binding protein, partial [Candidatus Nitrosotenuis sp.]